MIRFEQSLQLRRLVVLKSGGALYDEQYHRGVNIIRGENSSGKSTIADFIFFALGGEMTDWTPEAGSADSVHAEVVLSGVTYTLSRDVESSGRPPMYIYEGRYEDAMVRRDAWLKYPASRSSSTDSFSQVMFRLLRLPEQKTEAQQNITMHQLLRLLYCDQMTPVDEIFRHEKKFDTRDTRVAVAELLLGFDDLALHELRLAIRDADRRYGELVGELRSIFAVLGKTSDSDVAVLDLQIELNSLADERRAVEAQVEELSTKRDVSARKNASSKSNEVADKLRNVNEELNRRREREQVLTLDVEDSARFISTLKERMNALDASQGMADLLGAVTFSVCPACLSPIEAKNGGSTCHLCKTEMPESARWGHLKMREELAFQVKESSELLSVKKDELAKAKDDVLRLLLEQKTLLSQWREFERRADPIDAEIAGLQQRLGYLERSLEDLARKAELASLVKTKMAGRDELADHLNKLRSSLEASESARHARRSVVQYKLVELCVRALHQDLPLEEGFRDAELVQFDFAQNKLAVDGRTRFSASSATYLKNAFLFSMFELSLQDKEVRWPRFIMLDNIEDKGMQPRRSANFQEYVVERAAGYEVDHQVIMTTSMISPALENSVMCVGPHYTEENKSLQFRKSR